MQLKTIFCAFVLLVTSHLVTAQATVFSLLKSEVKLADEYFSKKDYQNALRLYKHAAKKKPSPEVQLKIARTHHLLNQHNESVAVYEKHRKTKQLPLKDLLYLAESLSGISKYDAALETFENYLAEAPENELVMQKMWRLNNIQYLYDDSALYEVRTLPVNSRNGEMCAVPYLDGVVFMSNRREVQPIEQVDAFSHAPFYKLYFSSNIPDTTGEQFTRLSEPVIFNRDLKPRFHVGPVSFYDGFKKMVFTAATGVNSRNGTRTLQLHFAERVNGSWKLISSFPHNTNEYSLTDPTMSKDGKLLFFSGDLKGGAGGKDLYKSEFLNGKWSKPVNLGETINTPGDESFPFFHNGTLYFASNGHPGLGGLDIFRAEQHDNFGTVENVGYPLNTNYDDFGISIDSANTHGYFSSNRSSGGRNDDIFQFNMDLQTYPLEIVGVLKSKDHSWSDSLDLKVMKNATLQLIDNVRDITVYETRSDSLGNFTLRVPHYSKFRIRVLGENFEEHVVSLEIPKHRRAHGRNEIVIVKDAFKPE